jgi:site-specific recombinase XerD
MDKQSEPATFLAPGCLFSRTGEFGMTLQTSILLEDAIWSYLQYLTEQGKSGITVNAYRNDLKQAIAFFGADCELSRITLSWVGRFLKSPQLLEKGPEQPRGAQSIKRSLRVFRMLLIWSQEQGWVETLPLPKAVSLGRSA